MNANKLVNLTIDGQAVSVPPGTTLLSAATLLGIKIPTLCYLKDQAPDGSCRMCVVEVEGQRKGGLTASCSEPCAEGMVVLTNSPRVRKSRRFVLDLLLSNHNVDCFKCAGNGDCRLQDYSLEYGLEATSYPQGAKTTDAPVDDSNHFYEFHPDKCIMCRKCARVCKTRQGAAALSIAGRGFDIQVTTPFELLRTDPSCESCGNCVSVCPTGALVSKDQKRRYRKYEVERTLTTCPHCAVGCQFELLTKDGILVGVEPADGPSNNGQLCVKGKYGSYKFVHSGDRVTKPLIKKDGVFVESSWDEALDLVATKIKGIKDSAGPDAIAGFSSSRCTNEDNYLFQKMMRAAIGTNNVDNCARV